MYEDADEKHLQAMSEMSELMKDANKMQSWFESKEQEFNSLPED
jgi:DNA-binding protein YbaB